MDYEFDWVGIGNTAVVIGTLLLVIFALFPLVVSVRNARETRRAANLARVDSKKTKERSVSSQAAKVYAFCAAIGGNARHLREPWFTVTNGSDLPIYNVTATITEEYSKKSTEIPMQNIRPGETTDRIYLPVSLLTRGWGWEEQFDKDNQRYYRMPDDAEGPFLVVALDFCDASNRRWKRDAAGVLEPVDIVGDPATP